MLNNYWRILLISPSSSLSKRLLKIIRSLIFLYSRRLLSNLLHFFLHLLYEFLSLTYHILDKRIFNCLSLVMIIFLQLIFDDSAQIQR